LSQHTGKYITTPYLVASVSAHELVPFSSNCFFLKRVALLLLRHTSFEALEQTDAMILLYYGAFLSARAHALVPFGGSAS